MNNMPKLFEVIIEDKDELKAQKFIGEFKNSFIDNNEIYLNNYIDADIGIALGQMKLAYKRYVIGAKWSEEKFKGVIYIIAKHRKMLIPSVFLNYGTKYDDGKLTQEINLEKRKYNIKEEQLKIERSKENEKKDISDEEQELLDYIAKSGGR